MVNVLIIIILSLKFYYRKRDKKKEKAPIKTLVDSYTAIFESLQNRKREHKKDVKHIKVMRPVSR